jgi:DNA ligase D-like protein (predicted ligase)
MSRNKKKLNETYPEIVEALLDQEADNFILDGEIVAFEGKHTSFARLQNRMHIRNAEAARQIKIPVYYYLFDMLYIDGVDISQLGLRHRKSWLKQACVFGDPLRYLPHRNEDGEAFYQEACAKGWEGLIAKQADSQYLNGRSRQWLKFKCVEQQELVIGGFTEPRGERIGFGALLTGYFEDGDLIYAGKVGTGYDDNTLKQLAGKLKSIQQESPPFVNDKELHEKDIHWVQPKLVAQIGFSEWTRTGKLRHPRFMGLRRDKKPGEVVREKAE